MMSAPEVDEAIREIQAGWQSLLDRASERVWRRTLPACDKTTFDEVIADFVSRGLGRPGPAEFFELCRQRDGKQPAGQRARRYGSTLEDDGWRDGMVPANEAGWNEAAAEAKRRLHAPTEAEKLEASALTAQRHAANEAASKPGWWG